MDSWRSGPYDLTILKGDSESMATLAWWARSITVLDTETTGVDTERDRIVSLAVIRVAPDGSVEPGSLACVIDPGVPVPPEAAAIHGITTERARAEGWRPAEALGAAAALVARCRDEGGPLTIFNAPFDWPLLSAECRRHGVALPAGVPLFDPLLVDRHCDRWRRGSRRLADVARHYGVLLADAHAADADAVAAAGVARALVRAYADDLAGMSAAELHARQAQWYSAWRDDLNAYWQRRGNPRRHTAQWPVGA